VSERLAARTSEAQALLARFGEITERAIDALTRDDALAFAAAIDARDALLPALERAGREITQLKSRFEGGDSSAAGRAAVARLIAPLEAVGRRIEALQRDLETRVDQARAALSEELARLTSSEEAASSYLARRPGAPRLDIRL
jgi:hypothetical protein